MRNDVLQQIWQGPMTAWPRRQRLLFVALAVLLMAAGVWWIISGARGHGGGWLWAGFVALCAATPMLGYGSRAISCTDEGPMLRAERRFMVEFSLAMPVYFVCVLFLFGSVRVIDGPVLKALAAVSPALPLAWVVVAATRLILGSDELQQRLHLQSLAIATGVVSVLSMALGFLVAARLLDLRGDILLWVFPVLAWTYGLVRWWLAWRLRRPAEDRT